MAKVVGSVRHHEGPIHEAPILFLDGTITHLDEDALSMLAPVLLGAWREFLFWGWSFTVIND